MKEYLLRVKRTLINFAMMCIRHLYRKKSRLYSTVASIAIGVSLVVTVSFMGEIGSEIITQEIESFGIGSLTLSVNKNISSVSLTSDKLEMIREVDGVEDAIPIIMEYTQAHLKDLVSSVALWGIESGSNQIISLSAIHGRLLSAQDILERKYVCVVDENMAVAFYGRSNIVGKSAQFVINGEKHSFEVVGVVASGGNIMQNMLSGYIPFFAYIPYNILQENSGKAGFDQIAISLVEQERADEMGEQIIRNLTGQDSEKTSMYNIENMFVQKEKLNRIMDTVRLLLISISAISLIVSGLGIMTVMSASVTERTREIGIKKAMGARDRIILSEFLIEGCTISFAGSVMGCTVGMLAVIGASAALGIRFVASAEIPLVCILIATVIGAIFSVKPAMSAAALNPVDALSFD